MPAPNDAFGDQLHSNGWRCGSTLPVEIYSIIAEHLRHSSRDAVPSHMPETDWLVVLSQTCDIVAKRLEQEPLLEILWCRPISKGRAQFTNRRSTRQLDFRPDRERWPTKYLSVHAIKDRYLIPRDLLATFMLNRPGNPGDSVV